MDIADVFKAFAEMRTEFERVTSITSKAKISAIMSNDEFKDARKTLTKQHKEAEPVEFEDEGGDDVFEVQESSDEETELAPLTGTALKPDIFPRILGGKQLTVLSNALRKTTTRISRER